MQRDIDESNRRRKIQEEYNKKNNITPQTIKKEIKDIIERERIETDSMDDLITEEEKKLKKKRLSDKELQEGLVSNLKKKMFKLAGDLEFEKAAYLRDFIGEIEKEKE